MGSRESVRRRVLLRLAGGAATAGLAGCTERLSGDGTSEPDEPPAGIEPDGVDLEQLLANVEAVLRDGEYEFTGWMNEREEDTSGSRDSVPATRLSHTDESGKGESGPARLGRAGAVDRDAEEGLRASVLSHDEPLDGDLREVADVVEYYDGDDGYLKRSGEDPEPWEPFRFLHDLILERYFAELSEVVSGLEYGEPTWDGDAAAYVVPVGLPDDAAEDYSVTVDGELHVDREGVAVWLGVRISGEEAPSDVGIDFTPGTARIEEPGWIDEVSE